MNATPDFLGIQKDPRSVIYEHTLTADLFSLMSTCNTCHSEGLCTLKKRLQRLSVPYRQDWGVAECKQAYLWHFGNPTIICDLPIPRHSPRLQNPLTFLWLRGKNFALIHTAPPRLMELKNVDSAAIDNRPCYSLGIHPSDAKAIALSATSHKGSPDAVPIRTFHFNFGTSAPVFILTTRIRCSPVMAGIWKQDGTEQKRFIVWKLKAPESPFADLELSTIISPPSGGENDWGELLIERALRTNSSQEYWEPLILALHENTKRDRLEKQLRHLIHVAIVENRPDFLSYLHKQRTLFHLRLSGNHLIEAVSMERTQCSIELLKFLKSRKLEQDQRLDEWLPLYAASRAMKAGRWKAVLPFLKACEIPDNLSPAVYRRLLKSIDFKLRQEHGASIRALFYNVVEIEPRITNCSEIIALAALLREDDYFTETVNNPEIDLPPWAGERVDDWISTCIQNQSSIYFALRTLKDYPDRFITFVKWLYNCDLEVPVKEGLMHYVGSVTKPWRQGNTDLRKAQQPKRRKL
jgi:hypothetical protein